MLRNYLKIAFRNLWKRPTLGLLTVAGLSVSLAVYWLLYAYVWHEHHYDQTTPNLYRLTQSAPNNDPWLQDHPVVSRSIASAVAGVEQLTRVKPVSGLVRSDWTTATETQMFLTDPTVFTTFGLSLQEGNATSFSSDPTAVVLARTISRKYFGNRSAIGQTIKVFGNDGLPTLTLHVVGIMADWPSTTHFQADFLIPYQEGASSEGNMGVFSYLKLHPMASPVNVERHINELKKAHSRAWKTDSSVTFHLQPVRDIHLYSHFNDELQANGSPQTLYVLAFMGLLVVLIASINFVNLTLAQSADRVREIGIRKVLGTTRRLIMHQFLMESAIFLGIAAGLAQLMVRLSMPVVTQFLGRDISQSLLTQLALGMPLLLLIGLVVSAYPALVLANYHPIHALKAVSPLRFLGGHRLRQGLTVVQFVLAMVLLTSTLIMNRQFGYIQHRPLGFDQEHIITIPLRSGVAQQHFSRLKEQLQRIPGVRRVAASHTVPGESFDGLPCKMPAEASVNGFGLDGFAANMLFMESNFFDLMGFRLVTGRQFDERNLQADSRYALLINETAVREYGWKEPQKALGKKIGVWNTTSRQIEPMEVVGVVGDFHYQSLHQPIESVLLKLADGTNQYGFASSMSVLSVKIDSQNMIETVVALETVWKRINPNLPFEFSFLDQRVKQLYQNDQKEGKLMLLFAVIAILITCFGLFSMTVLMVAKRTKEIGVRKVLGASVTSLARLLSEDFLKLVLIAIGIGSPLAWWAMTVWLQNFSYKTSIEWWVFALAGLLVLVIAIMTVSLQSVRAALMNPVKSLRTE